jgi:hypothetical protein
VASWLHRYVSRPRLGRTIMAQKNTTPRKSPADGHCVIISEVRPNASSAR